MTETALYPLRFEPIYQYRPWGGRRLQGIMGMSLPGEGPIGEAWLLSDRTDHASLVAEGPLKGATIRQLWQRSEQQLMGQRSGRFTRFPLLLKFLDVTGRLSVQVHPSDAQRELLPAGETGKTEAWVVLETGPAARIYAGLKAPTGAGVVQQAVAAGTLPDQLSSFTPALGIGVLVPAGTVHSLRDVVVFEVQENSDVTFRLYDWDQVDPLTGHRRALQVEKAMACIKFQLAAGTPATASLEQTHPVRRERLIHCGHFDVTQVNGSGAFAVGAATVPRVLVCLSGAGELEYAGNRYPMTRGQVLLLPAVVGVCVCHSNQTMSLLEISLPGDPDPC
jgi:mannose-6-phosphate isomerase